MAYCSEQRLRPYVARRVASAHEVDDLLQEIFIKLHQGLGSLRDGESFGGSVYRVARNVLVDCSRARSRQPASTAALADSAEAPAVDAGPSI